MKSSIIEGCIKSIGKDSMLLAKLNSCYNMEQLWLFCSVGLDNLTGSFTEEI